MPTRIITLTTDFGHSDHFTGVMRGVILGLWPAARIVDLCHDLPPFEITAAAFSVAESYRWFPNGTVHLVVVDPGVGTARRPILAEAAGQYFVAPDNGVLSMVFSREKHKVRAITAEKYFLQPVSQTFHGRDVFAPVGAHLARGTPPARFGKRIEDYLRLEFDRPVRTGKRFWTGSVLKIDRFGNMITNLRLEEFPAVETRPFELAVGTRVIRRLARAYADGQPGEVFLIEGSSGFLEVAANQASAAKTLGCATGAPVELRLW